MLKSITGQDSHLTVAVKQNVPRVECTPSDKPPVAQMCEYVLLDMPASKARQVFGNRGTAGIDVEIPYTMATCKIHTVRFPLWVIADWLTTAGLECVIKVRMTAGLRGGPVIRTSWYNIWQQALALTRLCAQAGKTGTSYLSGKQYLSFLEGRKLKRIVAAGGGPRRVTISIVNEARQGLAISASDGTSQQRIR